LSFNLKDLYYYHNVVGCSSGERINENKDAYLQSQQAGSKEISVYFFIVVIFSGFILKSNFCGEFIHGRSIKKIQYWMHSHAAGCDRPFL
jgi:hypothetical protein